jgi:hypothetical protein
MSFEEKKIKKGGGKGGKCQTKRMKGATKRKKGKSFLLPTFYFFLADNTRVRSTVPVLTWQIGTGIV